MTRTISDALIEAGIGAESALYVAVQKALGRGNRNTLVSRLCERARGDPDTMRGVAEWAKSRVPRSAALLRAAVADLVEVVEEDMRGETDGTADADTPEWARDTKEAPPAPAGPTPVWEKQPTPEQKRAERENAARIARTVLDTLEIREANGSKTPVGDVRAGRWHGLAATKERRAREGNFEAEFALIMRDYVSRQGHVPHDALTRDVASPETVAKFKAAAQAVADARRRITSVTPMAAE